MVTGQDPPGTSREGMGTLHRLGYNHASIWSEPLLRWWFGSELRLDLFDRERFIRAKKGMNLLKIPKEAASFVLGFRTENIREILPMQL